MVWFSERCGSPGSVDHATVNPSGDRHIVGTEVRFECNLGFEFNGDSTRTCESNREWTGNQPSCKGMYKYVCELENYATNLTCRIGY